MSSLRFTALRTTIHRPAQVVSAPRAQADLLAAAAAEKGEMRAQQECLSRSEQRGRSPERQVIQLAIPSIVVRWHTGDMPGPRSAAPPTPDASAARWAARNDPVNATLVCLESDRISACVESRKYIEDIAPSPQPHAEQQAAERQGCYGLAEHGDISKQ